MNNPKVSVVIPIYNVEKYLQQAIISITQQTLKEIEIIAVNDGSTDSSLTILTRLANADKRIKIISTINNGLSIARNLGIYMSSGEYIYFFDSDDILEKDTLEECYQKCQTQNLDFLFFDADCFTDTLEKDYTFDYQRTHKYEDKTFTGIEILKEQIETKGYRSSACLSFIKKEYLKKENLFFYPQTIHEDELFTFLLYLKAERVGLLKRTFFHRRVRRDSIMTSSFSMLNAMGYLTVCRELKKYSSQYQTNKRDSDLYKKRIKFLIDNLYSTAIIKLPETDTKLLKDILQTEFFSYISWKTFIKMNAPFIYNLYLKMK